MTSVSSSNAAQAYRPPPPPAGRERIGDRIQQGVSSGSISATDATALTSALDSIDAGLSPEVSGSAAPSRASSSTSARPSRPDPVAMKEKIDGLIADQVSAGSLTSAQADTLKSLFSGSGDDVQGVDGPKGAGGPKRAGGPPPAEAASSDDGPSGGALSEDANASASRLISDFLSQLQSRVSGSTGYGAAGTSSPNRTAASLVMDFDA